MAKHPGGRPTTYKPEYGQLLLDWFIEQTKAKQLPFLSKFMREVLGKSEDAGIEWSKLYPEFGVAYKKAKELQKEFLIQQTLAGHYNPTFAIFTAKNITDMRDKVEHEHEISIKSVILDA